jgi:hypothetical protein
MNNKINEKKSIKLRMKTSVLTEKYPHYGVNKWSIPILNSQPTTGFSRGGELEKFIVDSPIYLDYSSVSGGTR